MKKTTVYQFSNTGQNLLFWISQYIATKIYAVKEKKQISKKEKDALHVNILNSKDIDTLRNHTRIARQKGLYSIPEYLNPLYSLFMYATEDKKLDDIKKIDTTYINSYIEIALSDKAPNTQEQHYIQIKSLFKFIENNNADDFKFDIGLLRSGKRATSPIDKSKLKKQTFLEPSDLIKFLKKIKTLTFNHSNKFQAIVMIEFLCFGGLRKEEVTNIKFCDLTIEKMDNEKYLKILIVGKGNKERIVYIKYSLVKKDYEAFKNIRLDMTSESDALFITAKGTKYSHRTIEDTLARVFKNSGFGGRGLTAHSLRRSYSSYLYSKGISIEEISKLLGHSAIEMTETYIFLCQQKKYEIVDLLENI